MPAMPVNVNQQKVKPPKRIENSTHSAGEAKPWKNKDKLCQ